MLKNLPANTEEVKDSGWIHGLGWSPEIEHSKPLQYSCLQDPMDRGAWTATVHEITKQLDTIEAS